MKSSRRFYAFPLLVLFLIPGFIGLSVFSIQGKTSDSAVGFTSPKIPTNSTEELSNGQIESFWSLVDLYQNISEISNDTYNNYVKFANNGTHLFALLRTFSTTEWFSIEFEPDPSECMINLNDGWVFYIDADTSTVDAIDVKFVGTQIPSNDTNNDLAIESFFSGDLVYIEIVRPFNTQDSDGYDIVYSNGSINTLKFATNNNHFGSHDVYYLFITDVILGGDVVIIEPTNISIPNQVDLNQIKFALMGLTPIGVFGFLIIHFLRRVYFSPIKHNFDRTTKSSTTPPTFRERWKKTFSSGKE